MLEELAIVRERADAVIRVSFGERIQYLRHTLVGDRQVEIYFSLITREGTPVTEFRRVPAGPQFPGVEAIFPAQPRAQTQKLTLRFSAPLKFRLRPAGDRAIDLVVAGAAARVTAAPARYAVRLATFPSVAAMRRAAPVPGEFARYEVMVAQARREGRTEYDMLLGYFATAQAARQARDRLRRRFPLAEVIDLGEREPPRAAAPEPAPLPAPLPPPAAGAADVEQSAAELMAAARAALDAGDNAGATGRLNQLLLLPPNRQSQLAQELVGLARERAGETAKARAEYELYLRLYPAGEGAERVRKRLAALAAAPAAAAAPRPARGPLRTLTGSLSQYYYGGRTKVETAFNTPTTVDRATFTATDQSSLVTNVDLMLRNRTADADSRVVFRDTNSHSFLDTQRSYNRLNAAYYDYRGLANPFSARLGRQTGLAGGLPHRFDGAIAGYGFAQKWRLNAAAGVPVEYPEIDSDRHFFGTSLEFENLAGAWSGNVFAIEQRSDGLLDRRAAGAEARYFSPRATLFSLVDYDTSYKEVNIAMLQGTWQTEGRTTFNLLLDKRKAPTLTTTNAIFGQGTTSLEALRLTMTEEQLRQQARDVTATATQALVGFTTPLGEKWQGGIDARLTKVGALPSVVVNGMTIPAQPDTGNIYSYDARLIGTNLYSKRDTSVFSATLLDGPAQKGYLLAYNNLTLLRDRWTVEPSIRYYTQEDNMDVKLERWMPSLRLAWQVRESVALESEFSWEWTRTVGPMSEDTTSRGFFYLGYRWSFF